jgi:hypothetical protein
MEYEALGRGGQRINVSPTKNVIVVFTGEEFEPGEVGKFIGELIKSNKRLAENQAGFTRLTAAVSAAARPPEARPSEARLPQMSKVISGRTWLKAVLWD